ncbi:hypothetical protein [Botrimarina sp.]|uniref:hypothetical protein n=1 Tax=Botrimarina sp. TaxID=2795802 RepID=UPI0032EFE580
MRRRRSHAEESSLDLLLDTITNALGGVVLIALLVALLPKHSQTERGDRGELTSAVERLRRELRSAELQSEGLAEELSLAADLAAAGANAELKRLVADVQAARAGRDRLAAARDSAASRLTQAELRAEAFEQASLDSERAEKTASDELDRLKSLLAEEVASRTQPLPLPREQRARRASADAVVRYGRLYYMRNASPRDSHDANLEDFFDLGTEGGLLGERYRVLTPKPWRGVPILAGEGVSAAARASVAAWDPGSYDFHIAVWDDSFDAMVRLRECLVEEGFRYRLIPMTEGGEVQEGYVPDPRVQ